MKKRIDINKLIYISLFVLSGLLLISMFFVYLFTDVSEIFASIVSVIAAIIGVFASLIEYRRGNQLDLCSDIMTIYQNFLEVPTNKLIQYKLECIKRRNKNLFTDDDTTAIRNYLLYFNGVADKIITNDVKIGDINTILGYRFFLVMNCPYIQDREIIPNAQMYRRCIQLHNIWREWSAKHNFVRSGDVTSLDKRFIDYDKYATIE